MSSADAFLVVDDSAEMRTALERHLERLDFTPVISVNDGAEAWRVLGEQPVRCLICDWIMPKMDGLELLRRVRADARLRELPFLLITSVSERAQILRAIEAGVSNLLIKPFTIGSLREHLNKALLEPCPTNPPLLFDTPPEEQEVIGLTEGEHDERPRVLVVDDVPRNIDVIAGLLMDDYEVLAAINGEKALRLAGRSPPPDLILLDIMMPEMDGMEVCRRLKANPPTADIPVIFVTAKGETADITAGLDVGAVDYITKPATPAVLKARVRTHLRLKQAHDQLKRSNALLRENARLRDDIERIASHDLRNPIGVVMSSAEALRGSELEGTAEGYVSLIEGAGYDLLRQVNLTLDLYKMETGNYRPQSTPVNLVPMTQRVAREHRLLAAAAEVEVIALTNGAAVGRNDHAVVQGDAMNLHTLLSNLVQNAVEASHAEQEVTIDVIRGDQTVRIDVHNHGEVHPMIRERLFDKYATYGKEGGTGLGAYSARLIARNHGGDIVFTSARRRTCFSVTLPVKGKRD